MDELIIQTDKQDSDDLLDENDIILFIILVSVSAIWVATLSILMIKKRKLYPIKQMSVMLSVSSLIVLYLFTLQFIIISFTVESYSDDPHDQQQDNKIKAVIIDFYGYFTIFSFLFIEIMKQVRQVGITFNKLENKFIRFIKSETLILFICFVITLSITSFIILIRFINQYDHYNLQLIYDDGHSLYKKIAIYMMQIATIISLYRLRNTKYHYKDNVALIIFLIFIFAYINFSSIYDPHIYEEFTYYIGWAFFFVFTLIQYALPLYKSRRFHSCLIQSDILNSFETFIKVEMCVDIFVQFLSSPSQIKLIESVNQVERSKWEGNKQILYFYFRIKHQLDQQNNELSQDFARSTFNFYSAESTNVFTSIHNCEAAIERHFLSSDIEPDGILLFYYQLAQEKLNSLYQSEFTKTISFATIQKMLLLNDQIENNRDKLGMTDL